MLSEAAIRQAAAEIERLHRAVQSAFTARRNGPQGQEDWGRAWSALCPFEHDLLQLWDPAVWLEIRDKPGGWRDAALLFLEVDPWCFRSGHLKKKLCHVLKQARLTSDEQRRVRLLQQQVVKTRFRREFRACCRLAVHVVDERLLGDLNRLAAGSGPGVRTRARWMLDQLAQSLHIDSTAISNHPGRCDAAR